MAGLFLYGKAHKQFTDSGKRFNSGNVEAAKCFDREREALTLHHALDRVHLGESKTVFSSKKDKNALRILSRRPRTARRPLGILEEVIGRARGIFAFCFARRRGHDVAALMFQKPSRHHRRSKFLHPLVKDWTGLLSKIGGKGKARKFVTLQSIARSRQQEFPRGAGVVSGHVIYPE
jgi:hypothetical protein